MDNEILKTKQEIIFYIKESIKYFAIFTLTYIKQIALLILSIINCIIPAAITVLLLFTSTQVVISLITLLYCTITHIVIKKKLDNYIDKQFINNITQLEEKINNSGYNLGKSYRKLKKLQEKNYHQKEIIINTTVIQKQEETPVENKKNKYSYNYTNSYQPKDNYKKDHEKQKNNKKLTKKK